MLCYLTSLSQFPVVEFPDLTLELQMIDNTPVTVVPLFHPIRGTGSDGIARPHLGFTGWTGILGW